MGFLSTLFGVGGSTPERVQVQQSSKLPPEIAPFVKEVLGEAQTMYQADVDRGYDPYTGETIAGFTPLEEQSMAGLEGLAGSTKPYLDEALSTYRQGGEQFTGDTAQQYMSPYQQAVTDIELREAQRNFEGKTMPALEAQAINMGGMSGLGSRAGIEMAEAQRSQNQLLSDIQARGSAAAYQDARAGFEQQKAREQQMAGNIGMTGNALLSSGLQEQGILQSVGEQQRGLGQAVLDESYGKFLEEKNFPKQTLADYSNTIYGSAPSFKNSSTNKNTSTFKGAQSMGQQLLGLGMAGANSFNSGTLGKIGKGIGNFFNKEGGPVIPAQTGLSIQEQIKGLNQNYNKALNVKNVQDGVLTPGTAAYKRRADIKQSKNFLRGIESEDEAKIQQAMKNQFKNFPPDQARKLAIDTLQAYTPSQLKGGRGTTNTDKGLQGIINRQNFQGTKDVRTVGDLGKPKLKDVPSIYNTSKVTGQQPAGQFDKTINTLTGMLPVRYGRQKGQPVASDTTNLKRIGDLGSGQALTTQQPDVDKLITARETSISQTDPRFNVDAQRTKKTTALNNTIKSMRAGLTAKVKIQEEGYTEEDGKLNDFLDETEISIREDGATTSDIMADAIDQGMKQPTIVTMLTKVLTTNEKGVQKRAREVNKELRTLNKQKFIAEKEIRKGKRTDKLSNAEKESEIALKKIAGDLLITEDLEMIPSNLKKQAMAELSAISTLKTNDLNRSLEVYKVIAKYKQLGIEARKNELAAQEEKTPVKGPEYNALLKFFDTVVEGISDSSVGIVDGEPITKEARRRNAKINQIGAQILSGNMRDPYSGKTGAAAARSYIQNELENLKPID